MTTNAELQAFIAVLLRDVPRAFNEGLKFSFDRVFNEHTSRTAMNHYVVGNNVFFAAGVPMPAGRVKFGVTPVKLDPELYEAHMVWYNEYLDYERDWYRVSQTLKSIIMRAGSWQDVRDMLPENVINTIEVFPEVFALSRTRPDLFAGSSEHPNYETRLAERLVHWDEKLITMYGQIGPTIATYVGYQML